MERCSISPVTRLTTLSCFSLLLVAATIPPSTCNRDNGESEGQVEALSAPLSVTDQATPTPLWAVDWGPTHPLEDETHHFLSSQETDHQVATTSAETWSHHQGAPGSTEPQESLLEARDAEGEEDGEKEAEERQPEEVDPQFYVTVTISSLLILTAVIITAKLWIPVVNL
ncbi:PILR alpha-associated neural protein isoform X2 [Osmerus eperlanus]|uniref:PILR alpha-associated neural protein isoform X2 n=1 Tax=Osmerus eperlanus TaxID=29151 RepID=UPI002E147CC0